MMPPSITKYGSPVRLDAQIIALRPHCARTALKAPPKQAAKPTPKFASKRSKLKKTWERSK